MLLKYLIALIFRMIPESILLLKGAQWLSGGKGENKKAVYFGIVLGIAIFLIRRLPISFGVHTLIFAAMYTFILIKIFKLEIFKAISTGLLCLIALGFLDSLTVIFYTRILGISGEWLFSGDPISFVLSDLSLLLFMLVIFIIKTVQKGVVHGNS